jgi:large subunit ribosomal protein L7/L12
MKLIIGIGMVVTENRLRKLGFTEIKYVFNTKPNKIWVQGNHMTDSGNFADTIVYEPAKSRISASYGGMVSIPNYQRIESTWDIKQFLKEHPATNEKAIHEAEYGHKQEQYEIILLSYGLYKMGVMKELKKMFNLSLGEAKQLVNSAPIFIGNVTHRVDAESMKAQLEVIGATVEIK